MVAVTSLLLLSTSAQQPPHNPAFVSHLEAAIADKKDSLQTAVVAVARGGRITEFAVLGPNKSATADSVFQIGSLTKQFTASIVAILCREKKLDLTDTVGKWIPESPAAWHSVTVSQLLQHTSGLPEYTSTLALLANLKKPGGPLEVIKLVEKSKMLSKPGEKFEYNNTGYVMLGLIAERAGKAPIFVQIRKRITGPAGMKKTGRAGEFREVGAHDYKGIPSTFNATWAYSAGELASCAKDLALWDAYLSGNKLFSQFEKSAIFSPGSPVGLNSYNFGWMLTHRNGQLEGMGHSGHIPGYMSTISRNIAKGYCIIVLSNRDGSPIEELAARARLWVEKGASPTEKVITDPSPQIGIRHNQVLAAILKGAAKQEWFAPELWELVSKAKIPEWGEIASLELLSANHENGQFGRVYRLTTEKMRLRVQLEEDANGVITHLKLDPD